MDIIYIFSLDSKSLLEIHLQIIWLNHFIISEGNDSDDLIVQAFKAYDFEGKIDSKMFTHALMTWGDKMTKAEIDDIFGEFEIDEDYMIKTKDVVSLFVAQKEEEKKEATPPPPEPEPVPEEDEGDAKKKKKKKKKAAK